MDDISWERDPLVMLKFLRLRPIRPPDQACDKPGTCAKKITKEQTYEPTNERTDGWDNERPDER